MNNFSAPTTAIKTLMISLIAVSLFGGTAVIADQVGPSILTKKVSFGGLDLSTLYGQQVAQERVHRMASTLCSQSTAKFARGDVQ